MADEQKYITLLTKKGLMYETECLTTNSEFHITHIALGDGLGRETIPNENQTSLINEVKRYPITGEQVSVKDGLYYAILKVPEVDGGFTIRELGGYNSAGDLVLVANFPPTVKHIQVPDDLHKIYVRMDLCKINLKTFPSVVDPNLSMPSMEYVTNKLEDKAAIDLSNLNETGEQHFDTRYSKTDLSNLAAEGETHFDNKYVQKSGDTMTGPLTINTNKSTLLEEVLSDYTSPSAQDTLKTLLKCKSSNNKALCLLEYYQEGETRGVELSVRNSKLNSGALSLKINEAGDVYATAPNPAEDSNTNNIATTSWVNSKIPTEGDKYFLAKNRITNCLLEVPQRIKYTLENGTLTINAGTIVIVPYGTVNLTSTYPVGSTFIKDKFKVYDTQYSGGKFFVWVELQEDIPLVIPSSVTNPFEDGVILGLDDNGGNVFWGNTSIYNFVSGNTQPTPTTNILWYDIANNRIKMYRTSTSAWQDTDLGGMPFPFTFLFFSGVQIQILSMKKVYPYSVKTLNGMGYFGGLYWIDKGVKFLIPNGRNSDGTLNNIEYKRTTLYTGLQPATNRLVVSGENGTTPIIRSNYFISDTTPQYYGTETNRWFNPKENKMYENQNDPRKWVQVFDTPIAEYDTDGTSITTFKAYEPVQLENKIETWESEWFTSPGASKSVSFNLAGTGMNATNAPHIFMEMIGKVIDATSNYKVGDIVYPQFTNYNGSTGNKEEGQSVYFSGNTLTYAQGNSDSWVGTGANGGHGTLRVSDVQIKIILRRFNN